MIKERIKKLFSKSAISYNDKSLMQREMGLKLISKLVRTEINPKNILDIGAGTGCDSFKLSETYDEAEIVACDIAHGMMQYAKKTCESASYPVEFITADMEYLPFGHETFDLLYSNAAAHWVEDVGKLFARARDILKPRGVLSFSTFGPNTLEELNYSFNKAYKSLEREPKPHVNNFMSFEDIIIELKKANFLDISAEVEKKVVYYDSVKDLLKSLKAIGSHNRDSEREFIGKEVIEKMIENYESEFRKKDYIYATYIVYYFICRV